jgi:hypothetical protein
MTRFLLLSDCCGFVDVRRSVWRENGSATYNCCWSLSVQSFLGPSPAGLVTTFYCLRFETPPTWRLSPRTYIPQEQGGPVIPPGTGFPFCRLLQLAGLRWRYSNPPPRGTLRWIWVRVTLWLVVYLQSVRLGTEPLETHGQNFFSQMNTFGHSPYITSALTRG